MKKKTLVAFAAMLTLGVAIILGFMGYNLTREIAEEIGGNPARAEVVGEAPEGYFKGFESFTKGNDAFDVGINIYGSVIFVNNKAAINAVKKVCGKAIKEMQREDSALGSFRNGNIEDYYMVMGNLDIIDWKNVDVEVLQEKNFLDRFLSIYLSGNTHQD